KLLVNWEWPPAVLGNIFTAQDHAEIAGPSNGTVSEDLHPRVGFKPRDKERVFKLQGGGLKGGDQHRRRSRGAVRPGGSKPVMPAGYHRHRGREVMCVNLHIPEQRQISEY